VDLYLIIYFIKVTPEESIFEKNFLKYGDSK